MRISTFARFCIIYFTGLTFLCKSALALERVKDNQKLGIQTKVFRLIDFFICGRGNQNLIKFDCMDALYMWTHIKVLSYVKHLLNILRVAIYLCHTLVMPGIIYIQGNIFRAFMLICHVVFRCKYELSHALCNSLDYKITHA